MEPACWSDLPLDLATAVLLRLRPRLIDRVRFGAVCRQWRAAARDNPALPPHFPWIVLPDGRFYSLPGSAFQPLPVHLDGHRQLPVAQSSCGEWLVFERKDGALTLTSPFSSAAATTTMGPTIQKLAVCSDNIVGATMLDESRLDPRVVKLVACRPGTSSWALATEGFHSVFMVLQDIVQYQGQLYGLAIDRSLFSISFSVSRKGVPFVSQVCRVIAAERPIRRTPFNAAPPFYLFESHGTLLLIYKRVELDGEKRKRNQVQGAELDMGMKTKFVVFVADLEQRRWKRAECNPERRRAVPEDLVLFLGPWCSRSVAIPQDHRDKGYIDMRGNSIVFFPIDDPSAGDDHGKRVPFYCSVYDMKTRRSQSLQLASSLRPLIDFQATWLFPPSQP